jgi:hypothetical protein
MPGTQNSLRILFCLAACVVASLDVDAASVDAPDAGIARLLNEANRRAASGESADIVEQWLTQAMRANGMATTPPAWDVYGQKRWQAAQDANGAASTVMPVFVVSAEEPRAKGGGYIAASAGTADPPSFVSMPASVATNP